MLVVCAAGAFPPEVVEELLQPLGADRGFEVFELEVGEVDSQAAEALLDLIVRAWREPLPVAAEVVASLEPERERPVGLVPQSFTLQPRDYRGLVGG
jgi:hypothetical protein